MADDLEILKQQVKAREESLALEQKMLEAMQLSGDAKKDVAEQAKKVKELTEATQKTQGAMMKLEVQMSAELERQAMTRQRMVFLGGALLKAMDEIQKIAERHSNNINNTAQAMGKNVSEAEKFNAQLQSSIMSGNAMNTTLSEVTATAAELKNQFGGALDFSADQIVNLDVAAKKLGISNDTAAAFSKQMFAAGDAGDDLGVALMAGTKALSEASGVAFDKVMKDIASSGEAFANATGKSGKELAIAAVAARRMGFELSDMVSMSENLLDVENSIEKQMKFNMLTGKNINLDKARALAIEGDHEGMLKEVVKQAGDLEGLNQLQIKALNEALGVDIMKLKNAKQLEETRKADAAEAERIAGIEEQIRQGQLAEFEQKQVDREAAKTAFDQVAALNSNIKDSIATQTASLTSNKDLLLAMQVIQVAIQVAMAAQATAAALLSTKQKESLALAGRAVMKHVAGAVAIVGKAIGSIFSTLAQIPFGIGLPLAGAAVYGMFQLFKSGESAVPKGDDVLSAGSSDAGYGDRMLLGPEGAISLNNKDTVVAGTNLGGGGGKATINLQPLLDKMDQLIDAVNSNRILSVDGYQLNEVLHLEKTPSGY